MFLSIDFYTTKTVIISLKKLIILSLMTEFSRILLFELTVMSHKIIITTITLFTVRLLYLSVLLKAAVFVQISVFSACSDAHGLWSLASLVSFCKWHVWSICQPKHKPIIITLVFVCDLLQRVYFFQFKMDTTNIIWF